jgi:hypothetical protein
MSSGEQLPASLQEALASVGGLADNSSFNDMIARFVHQKVFLTVKFVREGEFATKGEGSTLFKYIKEGLKMEKASFKNWWVSGGWKKVRLQINKWRNTIQDALKHQAIEGK